MISPISSLFEQVIPPSWKGSVDAALLLAPRVAGCAIVFSICGVGVYSAYQIFSRKVSSSLPQQATRSAVSTAIKPPTITNDQLNWTILHFFNGQPDCKGRTFEGLLDADDKTLEDSHDWVQQVWPTITQSEYRSDSKEWILNRPTIQYMRNCPEHLNNLRKAYQRILQFYQLDGAIQNIPSRFQQGRLSWVYPGNHNYKRITRILSCLGLMGLEAERQDFMKRLDKLHSLPEAAEQIGISYSYWGFGAAEIPIFESHSVYP